MKNKIVFMINSPYPYNTGGRETWLNNVTNRLIDKYEIVVIAENHTIKSNLANRWHIDARIEQHNVNGLVTFSFLQRIYRSYLVFFDQYIKAKMMRRELKKHISTTQKVYVIVMDTVFVPIALSSIKNRYKNIRTIISSRGPHAEIYSSYWPLAKKIIFKLEKKNLSEADAIWANGFDTKELLRNKGFESKVIYNGVDCNLIYEHNIGVHNEFKNIKGIKVITIGTLLDLKGYPLMISAFKELSIIDSDKEFHLFAFGKGNPDRYNKMASDLGIKKYIHFLGEDKNAILYAKQANILLAMGTSEGSGMSMAALEMLASGVPVIATDIFCYKQLITNNKNGFLVPEGDSKALAKKIYDVSKLSKEQCYEIRKNAQNKVREFDWSVVVSMIEQEIERL